MAIEHEAKILGIDPDTVERRIQEKGGHKLGECFMRRYVYDITPGDESKWIRLRDNGTGIRLAVKEITSDAIDGAQLELDTWPHIPPYLEIEAATKADVIRTAELLGYTESDLTGENTIKIYARHGIDLNAIPALRF
ncbi:hypothetical protein ACFYTQ_29315 [Nocardia sp. NPDC004068]|uniref:hypothetical protein n=1 Tax=Nocardia sp. NPDC004068 TaxID=3364303 RepID=UPI0036C36C0E